MQRKLFFLFLSLCIMVCSESLYAQAKTSDFTPGVVRVKLQREVAARVNALKPSEAGIVATGLTPFDRVNSKVKAVSMKRLIPYSPKFEARHKAAGLDLWYEIRFTEEGVSPTEARNLYKAVPGIQVAESVRPVQPIGGESFRPLTAEELAKAASRAISKETPFNDPLLPDQWHYHNTGILAGSVAGADANVWEAWKTATGTNDVLVAIIDGGFQYDHPDLAQNAYINEAEKNGAPGVDDDGNGYVDDIYGYNFVINSADVAAHSHGTHVAGTVGAVSNNGVGVAGVAGGNGQGGVKMLICQIFEHRSSLAANNAAALVYAADMGASIAQCSWGWADPDHVEQSVIDAIDYFTLHGGGEKMDGGLCIFANGNTGLEGNYWPACYEKVVAVGAMDPMLSPAVYSSHGDWVDITAPGGNMDFGEKYGVLSTLPNSTYGYNEGTSMACPHVSGIAALVLSKYGSTNFTNENLRSQILSAVNDLYTRNPEAIGKFGAGYIDAHKALQMGTGEAPATIADFTLTPSQDNILVEWTIPEAPEKYVDHHTIYYSTEAFTAESDLTKLKSVTVDTKFNASGETKQYEIGGLTPTTTYYVAILAVNRYGNPSLLSPVKTATTNEGPQVAFDKTSIALDIDATASQTASDAFVIRNEGKGMLKFHLTAATKKASPSRYSLQGDAPVPGRLVQPTGHTAIKNISETPVVTADYQTEDYPVNFTYVRSASSYIGDSDLNLPNAQAQYFFVDPEIYPNGFNLTAVNIGGAYGENPVIEIYDGIASIVKANLLQTIEYDWFAYGWDINLSEQMYFPAGSSFWIVAKFPAGQDMPLGAGRFKGKATKNYSFYSCDNGETWTQLSEVLREGNMSHLADSLSWAITAVSNNPDWSSVLAPSPIEGTVRPGESQTVTMSNDGQTMVNGTYNYNLYVNTNQTNMPKQKLTVTMTVKGNKPKLTSAKVVDFGNILVGERKTLAVEIANIGYGAFSDPYGYIQEANISSSSDQFSVPTYHEAIAARSTTTFDVTFCPTRSGSLSGSVTLTDKDGITHSFIVRGMAAMPAKIVVDNTDIDFGDLSVGGEAKTATITVKNEGEYPLQYVFPKFSNEKIAGSGDVHKFGYTYISNLNGSTDFEYDGNPELANETDITSQFNVYNWQSSAIELGFQFPFYGTNYTKVHITSHGSVQMQTKDGNISCLVPVATCVEGLGYISAFANSGTLSFGANSKVTYGRQNGKFVVKYKNVLTGSYDGTEKPVSFHMALCPDGSIEMYYDDLNPYALFNDGRNIFIGVSDIDVEDPFVVTDADVVNDFEYDNIGTYEEAYLYQNIMTGSAIKILAPSKSMISALSSTDGVINIGESKDITISVAATEEHYAGELHNALTLVSNDPLTPGVSINLKANIVGESLQPKAAINVTSIDFGSVFRTAVATRTILLSNNGTADLHVKGVSVKGGKFTVATDIAQAFVVNPGTGKDLAVTLPTETEGSVSDEIIITFADESTLSIPVSGTVTGTPEWTMTPAAIEESVPYGQEIEKTISITNNGNEDLSFNVEPHSWITVKDMTADENTSIDYQFKSATDFSEIPYNWVDLMNDPEAEHQDMTYYLDKTDYYKVELPFDFPFYGKNYRTMYIYNTGFVSFSEHTDYKMFPEPPEAGLPTTTTFYTNIIAPFWGNHTMGSAAEDGTYYKVEDDHVVVSFLGYGNSMTWGMDYQVLLYKDGSYKFQYHLQDYGQLLGVFGIAGIQDEEGKRGYQLPEQYITPGNAVEFYPVKSYNVAKNGGSTNIDIRINTKQMANVYQSDLTFNTNVPTQPQVMLPVSLTISGEPAPVFPEAITGESVAGDPDTYQSVFDFNVANSGTKAFTITNVHFNPEPDYSDPDFDWDSYMPIPAYLMVYTTYEGWFGPETGWTQWQPGMSIEVGDEPVKFQLQVMDIGMPTTIELPITFTLEGVEETTKVVPFKYDYTLAPYMTFDKPGINFEHVANDFTGTDKVVIKNEGQYKLTYSLHLDPTGVGETVSDNDGNDPGIAPLNVHAPAFSDVQRDRFVSKNTAIVPHKKFEGFPYDVPDMECNNLLYYPILNVESPSTLFIGVGEDGIEDNFRAATRYTAPAEGFNLTHLYFFGTVGPLENVDIEATVIGSSDITSENIIGHGKLRVEKEEPYRENYYAGEPRLLEFDRPVYIHPNETFYVVLKYPAGHRNSAVLSAKSDRVSEGRYMAWLADYGWLDLGKELESIYGSMGYFMTCVEKEAGKPWITLGENVATEGEIAVGESIDVPVHINASTTYFDEDNRAVIVIKSNDPSQKVVNYPITLSKNAAPAVTTPEGTFTVAEASTAELPLTIADKEGDAFTVKISDQSGIAQLGTFTVTGEGEGEATLAEGIISVPAGKTLSLNLTLAPEYGTAGLHSVKVTTTDTNGNANFVTVNYNVEHTNRAPVYTGATEIALVKGETSPVFEYETLFTEPDNEEMTYHASVADTKIANIFNSESGFVISAVNAGNTTLTVTATDVNGARTSAEVALIVSLTDGIGNAGSANNGLTINTDNSETTLTIGSSVARADFRIYDAAGRLAAEHHATGLKPGDVCHIGMSDAPTGVYTIVANLDGKTTIAKFVKK